MFEPVKLIKAVTTYLGFFVLMVPTILVVGWLFAINADTATRVLIFRYVVTFLCIIVAVVASFARWKPEVLLRLVFCQHELQEFSEKISRYWWQKITPGEPGKVSFVFIRPDLPTNTVRMGGKTYGPDGKLLGRWETTACCIKLSEKKVFYYWKGIHRPHEVYEGFGEVSFAEQAGEMTTASGLFFDANISDMSKIARRSTDLWPATDSDIETMLGHNDEEKADLIQKAVGISEKDETTNSSVMDETLISTCDS